MDFALGPSEKAIQEAAREFARRELVSGAMRRDEEASFPWPELRRLWDAGYLGFTIPERWGGAGADLLGHTLALVEIAKADAALAVLMEVHNTLHAAAVLRWGGEDLKDEVLPRLARDRLGAFALTEPQAGSDAAAIETRAVQEGDLWRLTGQKAFITGAGEADYYVVFAQTDPARGHRGITAFEVPKDAPGLSFGPPQAKMGIRAAHTGAMFLDGVPVPDAWRLGAPGEGFRVALALLDQGRVGIAAQALGIAEAALEKAVEYAGRRVQFGRPIGHFQGIRWRLADLATEVEAARWLVYRAAWLLGQPGRHTADVSKAKLFASQVAVKAALEAIQIHGGYGYMREYGVERLLRDAKITEIYEGTSEIHRLVVADELLGRLAAGPGAK
ncbi:MAG: acyl-CoA dehydrogenase family protein [Clostridia bacterium]|nr:acyl-CoA dehydrogenase family protein [Clostridia bacterium]